MIKFKHNTGHHSKFGKKKEEKENDYFCKTSRIAINKERWDSKLYQFAAINAL